MVDADNGFIINECAFGRSRLIGRRRNEIDTTFSFFVILL